MDYNILRTIMANCVEGRRNNKTFRLNTFKLQNKVKEFGLIPVIYKNEYISKNIEPEDIPLISEYFKEDKLLWFNGNKTFLTMIFVREEDMDERLQDLLNDCGEYMRGERTKSSLPHNIRPIEQNPYCCKCDRYKKNIDIAETIANIVGQYPCYTAIVAKWVKEDSISLNIRFRANSFIINEN